MALVLTRLVVRVHVPAGDQSSHPGIAKFLMSLDHTVAVYGACFGLVGTHWVLHGAIMSYFRLGDRTLIWLTLVFLLPVTSVPFAAKLKDAYRASEGAVPLLAGVNILIGGVLAARWLYGTSRPELLRRPANGAVRWSMVRRITVSPVVVSLVAIAAARVHVYLSTVPFLAVPLFHLSHRQIDASGPGDVLGEESPGMGPKSGRSVVPLRERRWPPPRDPQDRQGGS
jgi:uncharacterized membrane protein